MTGVDVCDRRLLMDPALVTTLEPEVLHGIGHVDVVPGYARAFQPPLVALAAAEGLAYRPTMTLSAPARESSSA